MSSTLTYGFVKPATGDKGSTFWGQLEADIQQLNDHNHNGTNSAKLDASSSMAVVQNLTTTAWTEVDGTFHKTITIPAALTNVGGTVDDYSIQFRDFTTGEVAYLSFIKASSTQITVYTNDPTTTRKIYYT